MADDETGMLAGMFGDPEEEGSEDEARMVAVVAQSFWQFIVVLLFWEFLDKQEDQQATLESLLKGWKENLAKEQNRELDKYERVYKLMKEHLKAPPVTRKDMEERMGRIGGLAEDDIRKTVMAGMRMMKRRRKRGD